jgi:hypothetical protein
LWPSPSADDKMTASPEHNRASGHQPAGRRLIHMRDPPDDTLRGLTSRERWQLGKGANRKFRLKTARQPRFDYPNNKAIRQAI